MNASRKDTHEPVREGNVGVLVPPAVHHQCHVEPWNQGEITQLEDVCRTGFSVIFLLRTKHTSALQILQYDWVLEDQLMHKYTQLLLSTI